MAELAGSELLKLLKALFDGDTGLQALHGQELLDDLKALPDIPLILGQFAKATRQVCNRSLGFLQALHGPSLEVLQVRDPRLHFGHVAEVTRQVCEQILDALDTLLHQFDLAVDILLGCQVGLAVTAGSALDLLKALLQGRLRGDDVLLAGKLGPKVIGGHVDTGVDILANGVGPVAVLQALIYLVGDVGVAEEVLCLAVGQFTHPVVKVLAVENVLGH